MVNILSCHLPCKYIARKYKTDDNKICVELLHETKSNYTDNNHLNDLFQPYADNEILMNYTLPCGQLISGDGFRLDGVPIRLPIVEIAAKFFKENLTKIKNPNKKVRSCWLRKLFKEHHEEQLGERQSYILHGEIIVAMIIAGFSYDYNSRKRLFIVNASLKSVKKLDPEYLDNGRKYLVRKQF